MLCGVTGVGGALLALTSAFVGAGLPVAGCCFSGALAVWQPIKAKENVSTSDQLATRKKLTSGAKARHIFSYFAARLKSCPSRFA